uniref:Variant surface glycoprotein 535 n=1 Tax=Trypanosoma brucei TaxID=5691 RepID=M4SX99_9TRYP|nr:variant surface glycoprotein 535 [Trypanosoma brucei]
MRSTQRLEIVLLLVFVAVSADGNDDFGKAGAKVTSTCAEVEYFTKLAAELESKIQARQLKITAIATEEKRYELAAAAASDSEQKKKFLALASYLNAKHAAAQTAEKTVAAAVGNFVATAHRLAGALAAAHAVAQTSYEISTPSTGAVGGATATAKIQQTWSKTYTCGDGEIGGTGKIDESLDEFTTKKLYITPLAALTQYEGPRTMTLKATSDDNVQGSSTNSVFDTTPATAKIIKLAASANNAYLHITITKATEKRYTGQAGTTIGNEAADPRNCRSGVAADKHYIPPAETIAHELCLALKELAITSIYDGPTSGTALAEDSEFRELANALIQPDGKPKELTKGNAAADLQKLIKAAYGESSSNFNTATRDAANKLDVVYGTGAQVKKTKVENLATATESYTALSFLHAKNFQLEESINQKPIPKQEESDCTNKGTNDCDSDKCELKDGKCEVKANQETEGKDGKTNTKTTESNSFVIKASPLWPAFLLR